MIPSRDNILRFLAAILFFLTPAPLIAGEQGLLNLDIDSATGQVWLVFDRLPVEYLYVTALQSGAGSNDLGLDRGQIGRTRLVRFERYGNRVLLLEPNLRFRADTANNLERRAVEEAFAQSVLAGFPAESADDGLIRIDLAPLLLSDAPRIADLIRELEQGEFSVDSDRSAVDLSGILSFPLNTMIPVVMTLKGSEPGEFIRDVTPTPDSLTVRVTHQFVQLPGDGYRPRAFHPRSGYFDLHYRDYAAALDQPLDRRLIYRHALEPGETLRYFVDGGAPEPVRSALLEGASWWKDAFEAAGFDNGFSVDVLPGDVNPLDARYNVIQWVHRSTRGWSYGGSVADPRTGQIIKGHVSLGSLRVRQDQLIAEALTAPFTGPDANPTEAREMALARLRQLSAHEVGHTLGIDHNFAASSSGDASVMDYPHPALYLAEDGQIRLDEAYASGVSPWDVLTVRYGYAPFAPGEESAGLSVILNEASSLGIAFIADRDARVPGSAHPGAHLWDNGSDTLARLQELLEIRQAGLERFSPAVIPPGTPLFEMERRLVPVYLLHRYQVEASAKLLGGLYYGYDLKDDGETSLTPVTAEVQERALTALTGLLRPERLALPENLLYAVPPPPSGHWRDREYFPGQTGAAFDHFSPVRAGADLVIRELLQPQRLARLAEQHALNAELPGIPDVTTALLDASWRANRSRDGYLSAVQDEVDWRVLRGLMALAADPSAGDLVRASGTAALVALADELQPRARRGDEIAVAARHEIRRFLDRQPEDEPDAPDTLPPGSPIG